MTRAVYLLASLCLGGSDIFATVRENSPMGQFISNLSISGEPGPSAIRLCLSGKNADWLFLDGRAIRLNSSLTKVLDREVKGPSSFVFCGLTRSLNGPGCPLAFDLKTHLLVFPRFKERSSWPNWYVMKTTSCRCALRTAFRVLTYKNKLCPCVSNESHCFKIIALKTNISFFPELLQGHSGDTEWKWQLAAICGKDYTAAFH